LLLFLLLQLQRSDGNFVKSQNIRRRGHRVFYDDDVIDKALQLMQRVAVDSDVTTTCLCRRRYSVSSLDILAKEAKELFGILTRMVVETARRFVGLIAPFADEIGRDFGIG